MEPAPDRFEITRRNARSVQTTIGWIYWDPGATARYLDLGLPEVFAEPPCEALLARVDETAGPNYQPASRVRR